MPIEPFITSAQADQKIQEAIKDSAPSSGNLVVWVSKLGDDSNTGGKDSPFMTINRAIDYIKTIGGTVIIGAGDYYESVDLGVLKDGNYSIKSKAGDRVRVMGSDLLTGWIKEVSYSNVYKCNYTESVLIFPKYFGGSRLIFEDGNPSKPISNSERHPTQKNNFHRLPFTPILEKTTIQDVEDTPGTYALIDGVLYLHTTNSDDPSTNLFEYHVPQNTVIGAAGSNRQINLELSGIQFYYSLGGVNLDNIRKALISNCSSIVSLSSGGFQYSLGDLMFINCESSFCSNDGFNGHYSLPESYDNRSNLANVVYVNCWSHDNHDDGESCHTSYNVIMESCLLEYNVKAGCIAANGATYMISNCTSRFNKGSNIGAGGYGYGFVSAGNNININRIGTIVYLQNCYSEGNGYGIGTYTESECKLIAQNCTMRNNDRYEVYSDVGLVVLRNCYAENADTNKILGTNVGVIEIDDLKKIDNL